MPSKRDPAGRFVPGTTPNPGGRPKKLEDLVRQLSERGASDLAVDVLLEIAGADGRDGRRQAEDRDRQAAAQTILAYMYGKPRQQLSVEGKVEHAHQHLIGIVAAKLDALTPEKQRALLDATDAVLELPPGEGDGKDDDIA